MAVSTACIQQYKEIRPIIQLGNQYRLISAQKNEFSAVQYLSQDKKQGVLFVFRVHIPELTNLPVIKLQGLVPDKLYQIDSFDQPRSGTAWMEDACYVTVRNLESKVLLIGAMV